MKKIYAIAAAAAVFALLCLALIALRDVDVYGHEFTLDRRSLAFDGPEIDNFDGLLSQFKRFPFLKAADFGTFEISTAEAARLKDELPNVDVKYGTYVMMYGDRVRTASAIIDLSDKKITDLSELIDGLPYMTDLEAVTLGKNFFPHEDVAALEKEYPDVEFDIVSTYDIYGKTVKDNVKSIDLRYVEIDDALADNLAKLPELQTVDLRGKLIAVEVQLDLVKRFPNVTFLWEVEVGGLQYSSTVYELDLTDCWWINAETVRVRLPLFPNLTRLDMSGCDVTNEEMSAIRDENPDIKVVWLLTMGKWSLKTDAVAFSVLIVDYKHKRLTSDDIEVLKYCTDLRALDLGHQAITDISVIGEYLTELRVLILADNAITDLTPLANLKHLHYLEFFVNYVHDLTPLAGLDEMVDLNISYNYWLKDVTPLLNMPKLQRLWLESTSISDASVKLLKETYPYATIVKEGEGSVDKGWRSHPRYWAMMQMWYSNTISDLFTMYDGEE